MNDTIIKRVLYAGFFLVTSISQATIVHAAPAPSQLAFVNSTQSLGANVCSAQANVELRDTNGLATSTSNATVISLGGTSTTFYSNSSCSTALTSVTIGAGAKNQAFYFKSTQAGSQTLIATASMLSQANGNFTVTPGAAAAVVFTVQPAYTLTALKNIAPAVQVTVQDSWKNTATQFSGAVSLNVWSSGAGATLVGTPVVNAVKGIATFSNVAISKAGTGWCLEAFSGSLAIDWSITFDVLKPIAPPAALNTVLGGTDSSGLIANQCSSQAMVEIRDAQGLLTTSSQAIGVTLTAASVTFYSDSACSTAVTAVSVAAGTNSQGFYFKSTKAGTQSFTANSTGLTSSIRNFPLTAGAATSLAFTVQPPYTLTAMQTIAPAMQVTLRDNWSNIATTFTGNVTLGLWSAGTGASIVGTTTVAAVNGIATFSDVRVATPGKGWCLYAASGTLTYDWSITFDVLSGVSPSPSPSPSLGNPVSLSAVWANDGGDKITQNEKRATTNASAVKNSVWNGSRIHVFGAKNEVVAFDFILEAATAMASNVKVALDTLTGPGGVKISSAPVTGNGVFTWTHRNIEQFFIRYLPIKGLSALSYGTYDERHIPKRFQRSYDSYGIGTGLWTDRPDHDKNYPDIAVPSEMVPTFTIAAGTNQSIWTDIYIPQTAPAGLYQGTLTVYEGTHLSYQIPVELDVKNFSLPDVPSAKTMLFLGYPDIARRYVGTEYPNAGTSADNTLKTVRDRHFQLAHRHKISLIDGDAGSTNWPSDSPRPEWSSRLNGSLFSAANGYDGPGVNTGNGIYSIGTYGGWSWKGQTQTDMNNHCNAWESWFTANASSTDHFLYLIDESTNYAQTQSWANWMKTNPGVGKNLKSFATLNLPTARANVPDLDIATSWLTVGDTATWQSAADAQHADASKRFYAYNGHRPSGGSFATEDDGVALRVLSWAQYKKKVDRWYFWESTYYNDYQGGRGQTDVFNTAATFSGMTSIDPVTGEHGWNHSNGDGLLFYPGTDTVYPSSSYGLAGPIASLRLKQWRRGIQDVDYITLAAAKNPTLTQQIVNQMVPKVLWEYGVDSLQDPTYVRTNISWSINPDDWESARAQLAAIITGP